MLPIVLRPNGRRAVIVGGGSVALRKAETLVAAGFRVFVVAPSLDPELRALLDRALGSYVERAYDAGDLTDAFLIVAATDDDAVNARVIEDANALRVLACDAGAPDRSDFTMPAMLRVGDLTFAVDSGGSTPAFSKRIVREISERFGAEYGAAARTLARMRTYVRAVLGPQERGPVLRALAELPVDELAAMNPVEAEHRVEATIEHLRSPIPPPPTTSVVCASRASALAMTQTRMVAARLAERGIASTILNVTTTGDRVQDRPLAQIGSVNVFVKELELALRDHRADYAVHSCKDLPGMLEPDMRIAAISSREDPRDAFCSERYASFNDLPPGAIVGTSSLRRREQLQALRPDLRYEDIRGNVDTRLRKLRDGQYDAIVLAMAGLRRLRVKATHTVAFEVDEVVPAVAQGALAVETRLDDIVLAQALRDAVNDERTELAVLCERAALQTLRAGCNAPLGIHAWFDGTLLVAIGAFATGPDGVVRERMEAAVTDADEAIELGTRIGTALAARINPARVPVVVLPRTQERPSCIAAALRARGIDVVEVRDGEHGPDPAERAPDLLVFPSSGSVAAAQTYLQRLRSTPYRPRVAAMGPQSSAAASDAGFAPDAVAPEASVEAFIAVIQEQLIDR